MECRVCPSVSGEQRISPGETIFNGTHWMVEHGYPTRHSGWLVLVLKRHAEELADLSGEEFRELYYLQEFCVKLLKRKFKTQKQYLICLSESPGFKHLHVHIIPIPYDLPSRFRGTEIIRYLLCPEYEARADDIRNVCALLKKEFIHFST